MQPWYTSDITASYTWKQGPVKRKALWRVTFELNNLLNQQYDVILNYPMPGRNMAVSLDVTL